MKVLFTGGGTAGHINPAIAMAKYIRKRHPDWDILFVGTQAGLEKELVPKSGFNINFIEVKGLQKRFSLDTIITIKALIKGLFQARKVIKGYKPDIVIGTGGYVSGPVMLEASMMHIPTLIHESNALPGKTVKIFSRFADIVAVGFEESKMQLKKAKKIVQTGNPIREELVHANQEEAKRRLGLDEKPVILVIGGSLGAQKVNETVVDYIKQIYLTKQVSLIFSTGERHYHEVLTMLKEQGVDLEQDRDIQIMSYIHDMNLYLAADLVICRCGAMTLSEMTAMGKPAVLIPSPNVANNHQEYNAKALEKRGAAIVLTEDNLTGDLLHHQIDNLLHNNRLLKQMGKSSYEMGITNATEKLYNVIIELVNQKK